MRGRVRFLVGGLFSLGFLMPGTALGQMGMGACCLPSGACQMTTAAGCDLLGGTFHGSGVRCWEVNCGSGPTTGACCTPFGHCVMVTEAMCTQHGGTFHGGECANVSCPAPATGACCMPSGHCIEITEDHCTRHGGTFHGGECANVSCPTPATGACCMPNGRCVVITEDRCTRHGGTFHGGECAAVSCPTQPPPVWTGACCLESGTVCQELTPHECRMQGGHFLGRGTTCANSVCPDSAKGTAACYANCDGSETEPVLNVDDFVCFINNFAQAQGLTQEEQIASYANCDASVTPPVLNVDDFACFVNAFATGCR